MRQPVTSQAHRPQAMCEVCLAAAEFVRAHDALVNSGMDKVSDTGANSNHPILVRMHLARKSWDYNKGRRHTGAPHAPEVTP
jgi:hypothetical protein